MYDEERKERRRLYVASFRDDIPNLSRGLLIPRRVIYSAPERAVETKLEWYLRPGILLTFSVLVFALSLGSAAQSILSGSMSAAAPNAVPDVSEFAPRALNYGLLITYDEQSADVAYDNLVTEKNDFIELDMGVNELRLYASGTVSTTIPILQKPEPDSWWFIPTGSYTITTRTPKEYSAFANLYFPQSLRFGENYYIHGTPYYGDETRVPDGYEGGGVWLTDADATYVFATVATNTPIIVRGTSRTHDLFVYETDVPEMHARQYLVADIKSSTVLAAHGLTEIVPIASLTKLMTALVAAENIDLDRTVPIDDDGGTFVTTLIPRLKAGNSASMYSLLQLLLVESSNEASEVVADVLGRDTFLERMNDTARTLGLRDTSFTDPSGLDAGNVSTVSDLFRLVQYIYDNRGFILELTRDEHLPTAYTNGQFGQLANFNYIDDVNFVAGKVGETEAAGQTSVSLHTVQIQGEERLVAIILLGTDARTNDVKTLVSFIQKKYSE